MSNIVLLFGDNQFGIQEKLTFWQKAFTEKYGGDINIDTFEGKCDPNKIIEASEAVPFLAEKRLILVKHFLESNKPEALKDMAEKLKRVPDSSTIIFVEFKAPDKRTKLYKTLHKIGRLEECKPLVGQLLTDWIIEKAQSFGGKIDRNAATHLGVAIGSDAWRLNNEIQKLATYCGDDPITKEVINKLICANTSTTIFKLTDALGQKRVKTAIKMFHDLMNKGEAIPMVFSMLVRQFRMLIQIGDLMNQGLSAGAIAKRIKQHPYAVSSTMPQAKNYSQKDLKAIYEKLLIIDRDLKTGGFKFQTNDQREYLLRIEKFIVEACA
jgi:DNA polymerase III subunit delta